MLVECGLEFHTKATGSGWAALGLQSVLQGKGNSGALWKDGVEGAAALPGLEKAEHSQDRCLRSGRECEACAEHWSPSAPVLGSQSFSLTHRGFRLASPSYACMSHKLAILKRCGTEWLSAQE